MKLSSCAALASLLAVALPAGAAGVRVSVSPARLVLGEDKGASVSVTVDGGEVSDVVVLTSVGRVTELAARSTTAWSGKLVPPEEFYPHAAVVVALATVDGERRVGWTQVPLWGQGSLEAAGDPGAELFAEVGGRRYGPVVAGGDGLAQIPIQVAPGESAATAGGQVIELGAPDFLRVVPVVTVPKLTAHAELEARGELRFYVIDQGGAPLADPKIKLDASRGSFDAPVVAAPGVVVARYRAGPKSKPGEVKVRWSLAGSAPNKGTLSLELVRAPPPVEPTLEPFGDGNDRIAEDLKVFLPKALVVGKSDKVDVGLMLPAGSVEGVRFVASVGEVRDVREQSPGRYVATYYPPRERHPQLALVGAAAVVDGEPHVGFGTLPLKGQVSVKLRRQPPKSEVTLEVGGEIAGPVTADAKGNATIVADVMPGVTEASAGGAKVALSYPPSPRLLVLPAVPDLDAGAAETSVRLYVVSKSGELADDWVALSVDRGEIGEPEPVRAGVYTVRYRSPPDVGVAAFVGSINGDPASSTLRELAIVKPRQRIARAAPPPAPVKAAAAGGPASEDDDDDDDDGDDDVDGTARVSAAPPPARERSLLLLGAHGGFTSNFIALYAPMAAVDVTLQGSGLLDGAMAQLELGTLYQPGESRPTTGPLAGLVIPRHLVAVPLLATLDWRLRFGDFSVFAGAGPRVDYVYSIVGGGTEQFLSLGAVAQAAAGYQLGPGELVVKARYSYGGLENGFGAGTVLAGYAFDVF